MHTARAGRLSPSQPLCGAGWVLGEPLGSTDPHVGPCHTHSREAPNPAINPPAAIPGGVVQARAVALPSLLSPALVGPLRSIPGAPRPFSPHIPSFRL